MAQKNIALLIVISSALDGYRRAGIELQAGSNTLENITPEQLEVLDSDPRLTVIQAEGDASTSTGDGTTGNVDADVLPLVDIIRGLNTNDPELWTADNKPKASNFPAGTCKEDRDTAWEYHLAKLDIQGED